MTREHGEYREGGAERERMGERTERYGTERERMDDRTGREWTERDWDRGHDADVPGDGVFHFEHWFSWLLGLASIGLGIAGILGGFNIVHLRGDENAQLSGLSIANPATMLQNNFWDAALLLFSAITAGVLAYALHDNDHHRLHQMAWRADTEKGVWTFEHALSYLFALGSIAFVIVGLLTGFNAFSGH